MYFVCIWLLQISGGEWVERNRDCFLFCSFAFAGRDGRDGRKGLVGARGFPGPKGKGVCILKKGERASPAYSQANTAHVILFLNVIPSLSADVTIFILMNREFRPPSPSPKNLSNKS